MAETLDPVVSSPPRGLGDTGNATYASPRPTIEPDTLPPVLARNLILLLALLAGPALPEEQVDQWRVVVNFPMVWLPDIKGEVDIDGERTDIDIPISDILDNLDAGFIGELYLARGDWGVELRSMYLATESSSTTNSVGLPGRPPLIGKHRVTVEGKLFTSDLVGSYRFHERARLLLGVRRTGTEIDLRVKPLEEGLIPIEGKVSIADEELFDWIVGVEYRHPISHRWGAVVQVDTAFTGDNDTNRQFNGFFSYQLNERHGIWLGYRYLEIEDSIRSDGSRIKTSFRQQGPTLGWALSF